MMAGEYVGRGDVRWAEVILAPIDALVAEGWSPNEAFREVAGGLPGPEADRLRLYWEVSRETDFGRRVLADSFASSWSLFMEG